MVGVMVCMEKVMAMLMQVGKCTVFRMRVLTPMVVGMKVVIVIFVGICLMVMTVAMGSGAVVWMGIMAVRSVIFRTVAVVIVMCMFIMRMIMPGLY
jgi:hypothetical protein